jgi:hypothetical protein
MVNNKKLILITAAALICGIMFTPVIVSCNNQDVGNTTNNETIKPEEILAELPVYPGAAIITDEESGFEPFSTPLSPQVEGRHTGIIYETVSARYTVQARPDKIQDWYLAKLGAKGYREYANITYNGPAGYEVHSMGFYRPEQPLISIEVHFYDRPDTPVLVILVNKDTTTSPEPHEPSLPNDIDSIVVKYYENQNGSKEKIQTITDEGDIQKVVKVINDLPLLPDGPIVPVLERFSMILHSPSEGDFTLSYHRSVSEYTLVRISGYETLEDKQGRLLETVQVLLDILE